MRHDFCMILRVDRVDDREEVATCRIPTVRVLVGEVDVDEWVALDLGPHVAHSELVKTRDIDSADLVLLQQPLSPREHGLQEILVDLRLRGQKILDYRDKVTTMMGDLRWLFKYS